MQEHMNTQRAPLSHNTQDQRTHCSCKLLCPNFDYIFLLVSIARSTVPHRIANSRKHQKQYTLRYLALASHSSIVQTRPRDHPSMLQNCSTFQILYAYHLKFLVQETYNQTNILNTLARICTRTLQSTLLKLVP
jgi:hypothetical protein